MGDPNKYVVVDIGGTKVRSAFWNGHDLTQVDSYETPKINAQEFTKKLAEHISTKVGGDSIAGVGVSTAGPVDVKNGSILNPANLGNDDGSWFRYEIKKELIEILNISVSLDNDAAMTAYGQFHHFEKKQLKDLVLLTVGTGIGVGAMVDGQLVRAGQSMHPELGHFIVADFPTTEYETPFANYPTLESYLSGFHFSARVGKKIGKTLSGGELIELSEGNDPQISGLWEEYGQRMAVALANLYLAYFPKKFVLAGGFAMVAGPYFMNHATHTLEKILEGRSQAGMPIPPIEISANHDELPLLGAGYKIQENL